MQGLFILLNVKPHLQTMEMLEELLKIKAVCKNASIIKTVRHLRGQEHCVALPQEAGRRALVSNSAVRTGPPACPGGTRGTCEAMYSAGLSAARRRPSYVLEAAPWTLGKAASTEKLVGYQEVSMDYSPLQACLECRNWSPPGEEQPAGQCGCRGGQRSSPAQTLDRGWV